MSLKANPRDQKIQSVLYIMDKPLGKHGLDGIIGDDTLTAMRGATSRYGDASRAEMEQRLLDKLKDPKFREAALEKLKDMPQNKETIAATKWVLEAAGHPTAGMKDPVTGMMTGKMDKATEYALAHTQGGNVDATVVASAVGRDNIGTRDTIMASKSGSDFSKSFASAMEGRQVAQAPATPAPAIRNDLAP